MKTQSELLKMSKEEFDGFMCQTFPHMFINRHKTIQESCMAWGFDIRSGWHFNLYEMCLLLDEISQKGISITFNQIKEKFASGCFYYSCDNVGGLLSNKFNLLTKIVSCIVHTYESKCGRTDEITGEYIVRPVISDNGWIYAMSEKTFKEKFPNKNIRKDIE